MLKKSEKGYTDTSSYFMCMQKVSRKNNFFCAKEDKNLCRKTLFRRTEICLFCRDKTRRHFFHKTYAAHTHTFEHVCVDFPFEFFDILNRV